LKGTCGIDSLDEIAYLDGIDDVDTTIKRVTNPGGTVTTGSGATDVNMGYLYPSGKWIT
jgi:predicted enzyme related to lactoylglutathione lyase